MASRVAVIGAGPQGLSIAAHPNARGLQPLVFGRTMEFWRRNMPAGHEPISAGADCDLSSPDGEFTLERFCVARRLPGAEAGAPVALETFVAYGEAFQRHYAPQVDTRYVSRLGPRAKAFSLPSKTGLKSRRAPWSSRSALAPRRASRPRSPGFRVSL